MIDIEALHIDEISRYSNIPAGRVASLLVMLELKGFVTEVAPQTIKKIMHYFKIALLILTLEKKLFLNYTLGSWMIAVRLIPENR